MSYAQLKNTKTAEGRVYSIGIKHIRKLQNQQKKVIIKTLVLKSSIRYVT